MIDSNTIQGIHVKEQATADQPEPLAKTTTVTFSRPQKGNNSLGQLIHIDHSLDLETTFFQILLVNADSVNPQPPRPVFISQIGQSLGKVPVDGEDIRSDVDINWVLV